MNKDQPARKNHHDLHPRPNEAHRKLTPAEEKLWQAVQSKKLGGHKFRRQHPIGPYIVDFCCPYAKLVIEIDGDIHQKQPAPNRAHTADLENLGYAVLRFKSDDIENRLVEVLRAILTKLEE